MGLNYDLGDKSENLRRMTHFEKFNKANGKFILHIYIIIIYMIWDALYLHIICTKLPKSDETSGSIISVFTL